MVKVCGPEVEARVPTWSVAFSTTWAGDPAQKPDMPRLSPEEQAWCAARGGTDSLDRTTEVP